jgi:hypothetical protein
MEKLHEQADARQNATHNQERSINIMPQMEQTTDNGRSERATIDK